MHILGSKIHKPERVQIEYASWNEIKVYVCSVYSDECIQLKFYTVKLNEAKHLTLIFNLGQKSRCYKKNPKYNGSWVYIKKFNVMCSQFCISAKIGRNLEAKVTGGRGHFYHKTARKELGYLFRRHTLVIQESK